MKISETITDKIRRAWGIRHIRAQVLTIKINRHYMSLKDYGFVGGWNKLEIEAVRKIRAGEL